MIERYDPFGRLMSLRQMMDRLLEDAFIMPRNGHEQAEAQAGALNVYEEGDDFVVEAQLPGMRPEDIQVTVDRGTLTIRGETRAEQERRERNYLIREQRRGSFTRSLRLPESVDPDSVQASFENGVLRLTFKRTEQAKPRRIAVTGGSQRALSGNGQAAMQGEAHSGRTADSGAAERRSEAAPAAGEGRGR